MATVARSSTSSERLISACEFAEEDARRIANDWPNMALLSKQVAFAEIGSSRVSVNRLQKAVDTGDIPEASKARALRALDHAKHAIDELTKIGRSDGL
jgi:hypothetical protein